MRVKITQKSHGKSKVKQIRDFYTKNLDVRIPLFPLLKNTVDTMKNAYPRCFSLHSISAFGNEKALRVHCFRANRTRNRAERVRTNRLKSIILHDSRSMWYRLQIHAISSLMLFESVKVSFTISTSTRSQSRFRQI